MEASSTPSTGSKTIADMLPLAAAMYADRPAVRHKVGDEWLDVSFAEVGEIVSEVGRGLIDLGLEPGERVSILCGTRPEWVYSSFAISAAGGVVVPIYPTNSPKECEWVAGNSESTVIVVEDAEQYAKVAEVRDRLPQLKTIIAIEHSDGTPDAISLDEIRERGRGRDEQELVARYEAVKPEDPYTFIYTSGTTGPPKGCVLSQANYRAVLDMTNERGLFGSGEDVVYLFLPLAHAFAILVALGAADTGTAIAYWTGDTTKIIADIGEVKPTFLPSVPRIFEKLYTMVAGNVDPEMLAKATAVGVQVRDLQITGQPVPEELQAAFDQFDEKLFVNVRAAFGGQVREAVTGAAPIARQILEFFYAAGVPVMEGYGMTETATVATTSSPEAHRFGSVGRALPGVEIKIAEEDGEILLKGANIFGGYWKNDDASFGAVIDGWLHTGDVGKVDEDGFLFITGRKKDIIITAGGKNLTPANLENDMKQTRFVSQAVMHGDRRPYPVMLITLDEEQIIPWAGEQGIEDASIASLATNPQVLEIIQGELDRANDHYAPVEQVKKFFILEHDLTQETGELTPTMKVKRNVVEEKYGDRFDTLYEG